MTVAEELRAWDWERGHPLRREFDGGLTIAAFRVLEYHALQRLQTSVCWPGMCPSDRAEIMSEAIEAAEALGL